MKKELIIKIFGHLLIFIVVWDLLDFLYATLISKSGFVLNVKDSLIEPLITGIICAVFLNVLPQIYLNRLPEGDVAPK